MPHIPTEYWWYTGRASRCREPSRGPSTQTKVRFFQNKAQGTFTHTQHVGVNYPHPQGSSAGAAGRSFPGRMFMKALSSVMKKNSQSDYSVPQETQLENKVSPVLQLYSSIFTTHSVLWDDSLPSTTKGYICTTHFVLLPSELTCSCFSLAIPK